MMEDVKQGWKIQGSQPVSSHSHGKLTVAQKQIISVILSLISLALVLVLVFAVAVPRYGYHRAFGQITRAYNRRESRPDKLAEFCVSPASSNRLSRCYYQVLDDMTYLPYPDADEPQKTIRQQYQNLSRKYGDNWKVHYRVLYRQPLSGSELQGLKSTAFAQELNRQFGDYSFYVNILQQFANTRKAFYKQINDNRKILGKMPLPRSVIQDDVEKAVKYQQQITDDAWNVKDAMYVTVRFTLSGDKKTDTLDKKFLMARGPHGWYLLRTSLNYNALNIMEKQPALFTNTTPKNQKGPTRSH